MSAALRAQRIQEAEARTMRAVVASQAELALREAARLTAEGRKTLAASVATAEKSKEALWDAIFPDRKRKATAAGSAFMAATTAGINRFGAVVEARPAVLISDYVSAAAWLVACEAESAPAGEAKAWRDLARDLSRVAERTPGKRDMQFISDFVGAR